MYDTGIREYANFCRWNSRSYLRPSGVACLREAISFRAQGIAAVGSFLAIVPKELAKGNIVELGDFGSFWLRTNAEGVETPAAVTADQINTILPRFMPGKGFKDILEKIKFNRN